jgi:predicted kinase
MFATTCSLGSIIHSRYFSIEDPKEAAECLAEMDSPGYHAEFVGHGISVVFDGTAKQREQLVRARARARARVRVRVFVCVRACVCACARVRVHSFPRFA